MEGTILKLKRIKLKLRVLAILSSTFLLFIFLQNCDSAKEEQEYLNHAEGVNYVGMQVCAECHETKLSTFLHTGMGQSFGKALLHKSSALFGREHLVYDSVLNYYYYPHWKNNQLYIMEFSLKGIDTVHKLDVRIDYIIGSGQHTNSHLYSSGSFLFQGPITFYVQDSLWDLAPGFENGNNSRFSRILNVECISCHNSMPGLNDHTGYSFAQIGSGIDCERCHGPGELHVKWRRENRNFEPGKDKSIVNPRYLSMDRQIDICQRCHLQGLNLLQEGKSFRDFLPGMDLSSVFEIYLPQYKGLDSRFDMANHSARFQQSRCFTESQSGSFTCISCHNPHISVKYTRTELFNSTCNSCHSDASCSENKSRRVAVDDNCVQCHMPRQGAEDIPHVTVHDHYIRNPSENPVKEIQIEPTNLYAVNNDKPSVRNKIRAYLEYYEKFDKNPVFLKRAEDLLQEEPFADLQMRYHYLISQYKEVISVYNKESPELDHWTAYLLAESYYQLDEIESALAAFRLSDKLLPGHPVIRRRFFLVLVHEKRWDEADKFADYLKKGYPYDARIYAGLASLKMIRGEIEESGKLLEKALMFDPNEVKVWEAYVNFYLQKRQMNDARKWAAKILEHYPNHVNKALLNQILLS